MCLASAEVPDGSERRPEAARLHSGDAPDDSRNAGADVEALFLAEAVRQGRFTRETADELLSTRRKVEDMTVAELAIARGLMTGRQARETYGSAILARPGAIPGLELRERTGEGLAGPVYGARQSERREATGRTVVVQVILPEFARDGAFAARVLDAADAAKQIDHPGIARTLEAGRAGGALYVVSEPTDGRPLSALLEDGKGMSEGEALAVGLRVAEALAVAHAAGLMHGDLNPSSIMVRADGSARLAGFGTVPAASEATLMPVPQRFLSPERMRGGEPSVSDDLYALGVVLHVALFGRLPFEAPDGSASALMARKEEVGHSGSAAARLVIAHLVAGSPARRYAHAATLARDLREVIEGRDPPGAIALSRAAHAPGVAAAGRRAVGPFAFAIAIAVFLVGAVPVWWLSSGTGRAEARRRAWDELRAELAAMRPRTAAEIEPAEPGAAALALQEALDVAGSSPDGSEEAIAGLRRVASAYPGTPEAGRAQAVADERAERRERSAGGTAGVAAQASLEEALLRARDLEVQGRFGEAVAILDFLAGANKGTRAARIAAGNAEGVRERAGTAFGQDVERARVLVREGRYDEAIGIYRKSAMFIGLPSVVEEATREIDLLAMGRRR